MDCIQSVILSDQMLSLYWRFLWNFKKILGTDNIRVLTDRVASVTQDDIWIDLSVSLVDFSCVHLVFNTRFERPNESNVNLMTFHRLQIQIEVEWCVSPYRVVHNSTAKYSTQYFWHAFWGSSLCSESRQRDGGNHQGSTPAINATASAVQFNLCSLSEIERLAQAINKPKNTKNNNNQSKHCKVAQGRRQEKNCKQLMVFVLLACWHFKSQTYTHCKEDGGKGGWKREQGSICQTRATVGRPQ